MTIRDLDFNTKITDLENFFDVVEDPDDNRIYRYNLNSTVNIEVEDDKLLTTKLRTDSYWTLISYQLYGTTRLAWLLMKINKVKGKDIFNKLYSGDEVKYIDKEDVKSILKVIRV